MTESPRHRPHHRPAMPGAMHFESVEGGPDPAVLRDAAERAAVALVRGTAADDHALVERVVTLADREGLETLAELWSGAAPDSIAGTLWRLYLLRTWVHTNPQQAADEFGSGRAATPVDEVVAGVADPPGPDEVRRLADDVLAGVVRGDYADVLFRAAAFARVAASGRVRSERDRTVTGSTYDTDLSASRLVTMADQLEHAARLELEGQLG